MQDTEMSDAEALLETIDLTPETLAEMTADIDENKVVTFAGRTAQTHDELDAIVSAALAIAEAALPEPEPVEPFTGFVTVAQMNDAIEAHLAAFRTEFVKEVMDALPEIIAHATKPKAAPKNKPETAK